MILICIDHACTFLEHFRGSASFAVHVLSESQRDLSVRFSEMPEGRFEGVEWRTGDTGAPLLAGCLATVECRVVTITEAGDHAIFLGEVVNAESHDGRPLVYFNRDYRFLR